VFAPDVYEKRGEADRVLVAVSDNPALELHRKPTIPLYEVDTDGSGVVSVTDYRVIGDRLVTLEESVDSLEDDVDSLGEDVSSVEDSVNELDNHDHEGDTLTPSKVFPTTAQGHPRFPDKESAEQAINEYDLPANTTLYVEDTKTLYLVADEASED